MTSPPERLTAAFADRYPLECELGSGGMATVYLARDEKHRRKVAVKVLHPELAAVLGAERFLHEIEIAARLSHPHILPLYDSGQVDGLLFYVMPHIDGESLRGRLDRERQLPVEEAVRLGRQVAAALDYAHRQQVVHRDIKPENILLHEGEALVADFGIALAVRAAGGGRMTGTGLSLGTPLYMSPEQATGERQIDARSDVYSLGCVMYEMLAGEPPYDGPTTQAIVARILTERPRGLHVLRETVPPALGRVIERSLARLPADRYATAAEFSAALARAVESSDVPAQAPVAAVEAPAVVRWRRRLPPLSRSLPWIVAAAGLGIAAATALRPRTAALDPTPAEVSTEELRMILAENRAVVLDARPHLEYAIGHIPGALNVAARPGVPPSIYISDVAEVARVVGGDMGRAIVLYCNGPFCPKSGRLTAELEAAGHTDVRRYQLGIPVWRAFGGVTVIEADGLRYVLAGDRTAVVLDVRDTAAYRAGTLPGARHLPRSAVLDGRDVGEIRRAKDDGRLPMHDHNTRVIIVGGRPEDARFVAQALANEAFHNVSYFAGTFEEARAALRR